MKPATRKRGRPPLPESERRVQIGTTIAQDEAEYLRSIGDGIEGRGAQRLIRHAAANNLKVKGVK